MTEELTKKDGVLPSTPAHIVNQPGHQIGDKVLSLCGEKVKVTILWADIPPEHPTCRDCVDSALRALSASTNQVTDIGVALLRAQRAMTRVLDEVAATNDATVLVELTEAYAERRAEKAQRKQDLADARAMVEQADKKAEKKKGKKKE